MREFAEQEIIIPDGPYEGMRYLCSRQPYTRLWFDAIDSGRWSRFNATGPTQSGKTLCGFVIPACFHLFEIGETVICGIPDMDMASDKWREDFLPVIQRSRYRDYLPRQGAGSRGGKVDAIQFRNGATLKFMSGGGGDKSRAGFTSRVLVITETDGMDEPGGGSREADKITQLEARTRAYGARRRVYMECTVSIEEGRTWREYKDGTESRIVLPCPHCRAFVSPEREHLVGWKEYETVVTARKHAAFCCPSCGALWTEEERRWANLKAVLVHGGQRVEKHGKIVGKVPETDTLGFRWSAVNNLFLSASDNASDEWKAARSDDEENAEKEMLQFVWAVPYKSSTVEHEAVSSTGIMKRQRSLPRGRVPQCAEYLTLGVDIGKWLIHWTLISWEPEVHGHVVDYGRVEVPSGEIGAERGILTALREFRDQVLAGWPIGTGDEEDRKVPDQVWIDAGYLPDTIYEFCAETSPGPKARFRPVIGRGEGQQGRQTYNRPKATGNIVRHVGEEYHVIYHKQSGLYLVEANADYWKTWVHRRFTTPADKPGSLTLFEVPAPVKHLSFAKHLTAEKKVEEFIAGKGTVLRWERISSNNHWFDSTYYACAAGHMTGARLIKSERPAQTRQRKKRRFTMPDGRPFLVTER
jgi:phage terminase large subunit GpA-like protein